MTTIYNPDTTAQILYAAAQAMDGNNGRADFDALPAAVREGLTSAGFVVRNAAGLFGPVVRVWTGAAWAAEVAEHNATTRALVDRFNAPHRAFDAEGAILARNAAHLLA